MPGEQPFTITEWDWFKVQVRIRTLELSGKLKVTRYAFSDEMEEPALSRFPQASAECLFWCRTTEELLKKKSSRAEHLKFYVTWVRSEKAGLTNIVRQFPGLSKEIHLDKNIVFTVLHDYGGGSVAVCHFHDGKVLWEMDVDRVPE